MNIKVLMKDFEIHTTPLEKISIDTNSVDICLDDIMENRYIISAKPYQGIKIKSIDCVSSKDYFHEFCFRGERYHRHILQVEDSEFLVELKGKASDASFLNNSKHFVLPLQDIFIEIIAYELSVEKMK